MAADRELVRTLASQPGFASVTAMPDLTASIPAFSDSSSAASGMRKCAGLRVAYQHGGGAAQSGWSDGMTLAVASSKVSGTASVASNDREATGNLVEMGRRTTDGVPR
ncbi:unnamed protein product [Ixodes pacificus]